MKMLPPQRILVVELADIGDLILATPALAALRASFPTARLDVVTTGPAAPILQGTGLVDHVLIFNKSAFNSPQSLAHFGNWQMGLRLARQLRTGHYDTVLIFHQLTSRFGTLKYAVLALATGAAQRIGLDNGRGWFLTARAVDQGFGTKHQADYWLDVAALLGANIQEKHLHIGISDADRQWAREHLPEAKNLFAFHPGSGGYSVARRWEPAKFAQLADHLHESRNATIVLVGSPTDGGDEVLRLMTHSPINLIGKTTINQLAAVLERCELYIGADSGILHIANAVGTATFGIYGPSNHHAWQPYDRTQSLVIRSGVACSPCSYVGHTVGLRNGCDARTCMKLVTPREVVGRIPPNQYASPYREVRRRLLPQALNVLGVPVDGLTYKDMLDRMADLIRNNKNGQFVSQICTVNSEFIMLAQEDVNFFNILNRANLCLPDGVGLLWAARRLGHTLPERVTGSDGVYYIAERAAQEGWRLFLLGAAPGIAEKTANIFCTRYPGLQIAGTYSGSPSAAEEDDIVAMVNASQADILFVAYGAPRQDKWVARNLPRLQVTIAMGVGGAFDFVAGVTSRAPIWMRNAGIEWLHRLIAQPWRWRRMLRLPRFVITFLRRGNAGPPAFIGGES